MTKKCYLILLAGQGDTDIKIVNKDTWDWIMGDGEVPPHQVEAFIKSCHENESEVITEEAAREYLNSSGSCDNDKALKCKADFEEFTSMKSAMQYIYKHDLEVVDEYEGYIY